MVCEVNNQKLAIKQVNLAVGDFAFAFDDSSDGISLFAHALQDRLCFLEFRRGNHHQHSHAHVESAEHLFLRHVSELLEMLKDREHGPGAKFNSGSSSSWQHPRQIFSDASASDMGQ